MFTIGLIGLTMLLFDNARTSGRGLRCAVTPVAAVFTATVAWFVISLYVLPAYPGTASAVRIVDGALGVAVPVAILLGQVSGDMFAAMSLGQIAVRARGAPLVSGGRAEADRRCTRGFDHRDRAVGARTRRLCRCRGCAPFELPSGRRLRGVTHLTNGNGPIAALIHDPTLETDSDVVEGLAAISLMLLENTRLVEELRASRSRIVEAAERERQLLERDLHDGAQQQLVAIQVRLAPARQLADSDDLAKQLDATQKHADAAVSELRALAHGIYPGVLHELGPVAALRDLSINSTVPIKVTDDGVGRSSDAIEAAIYFCAREAIQNTAKHAGPGAKVAVSLAHRDHAIQFTVTDDGVGMSTDRHADGIGITSMRDRIEAVGGQLEIASRPGHGTSIYGTIPDSGR